MAEQITYLMVGYSYKWQDAVVHIRGIVDKKYVVYCKWSGNYKGWQYQIQHAYFFKLLANQPWFKYNGPTKAKSLPHLLALNLPDPEVILLDSCMPPEIPDFQ